MSVGRATCKHPRYRSAILEREENGIPTVKWCELCGAIWFAVVGRWRKPKNAE